MYDDNNIFARILRNEMPCHKIMEDEKILAFMDVMPQTPGHVLVIPKTPAENLLDLPAEDAAYLIKAVQKIARAVKQAMEAPGLMIAQLNGAEAGQTVFHIHFHIIPRCEGIDMKLHAREMESPETLAAQAEKIRAALNP